MNIVQDILSLTLQKKLLILFLSFSIIPLFILGAYSANNLRDTVYNEKKDSLTRAVSIAYSIVDDNYKKFQNGLLNETFAKNQSLETLKILRYGSIDKDYFWVHEELGSKPFMVMHPFSIQLNGQDLSSYKDPNGVFLFNEMDKVVNEHGSGFVQYSWQYYDNVNLIVPKLSFVKIFPGWNWIIGTGFYIQDVDAIMINELTILTSLIISTVAIVSILTFTVSRTISRPIIALSKSNALLAKGDLREKITKSKRRDEIGELTKSYNETLNFLNNIITELSLHSDMLYNSANEIASSTEEVSASSEEISAISQQMSKGAQEQAQKVLQSVDEVNSLENLFFEKIGSIKQTASIIESITSQVNMLALNASIEAARAGEYGRGFAVVADNIRRLADTTKSSLADVNTNIKEIESRLSSSITNIKISIESVSSISEETASGSEEASASTQEQSATLEELSSKSQELSVIAKKLQDLVYRFKT